MKKKEGMKIGMLLIIVILMGLPVITMHVTTITTIQSGGSESAAVMAGNQTNTTIFGDSAYIEGYYPALDLYVTLPTDISGPMITPFLINVTAAGQAVAELYTGNALYYRSQFTGHIVIQNNVSYTGNVNLTLDIISSQGVVQYRWLPDFMSPVTYISYEKAKETTILAGLTPEEVGALGVTVILSTVAFFKIFYPGAKDYVRKQWIKEGPKRHV
jgi:hypothetical protein